MSNGDPYVYPGTNVLKNLFNERDKSRLDEKEQRVTFRAMKELGRNPVKGKLDGAHLKEIHKRIFEKIYPFAGRDVKAVALANFDKAPVNNDRINIIIKEPVKTIQQDNKPQEKSNETRTVKVAPPKSKDHDRGR